MELYINFDKITKDLNISVKKTTTSVNLAVANIQPSSASVAEGDSFTFYVYILSSNSGNT